MGQNVASVGQNVTYGGGGAEKWRTGQNAKLECYNCRHTLFYPNMYFIAPLPHLITSFIKNSIAPRAWISNGINILNRGAIIHPCHTMNVRLNKKRKHGQVITPTTTTTIWVGAYWFSATAILDFSVSGLCRWQGFRDVSEVCFGISISNFIRMLMVVIGKSLLIFSEITFKMAAWWPYWIFWFPDSNFSLALNINSKLKLHNTCVYL